MENSGEMRPSDQQLEALANFLAQNPGVAKGCLRTAHGRRQVKVKWTAFAKHANSLGGAEKDRLGWAKYWADKKCSLKKSCNLRRKCSKAGGPAVYLDELSPIEQRLVAVMGGEPTVGDPQTVLVDVFPSTSKTNHESPPASTPGSPASPTNSTESSEYHSPARDESLLVAHPQRREESTVLNQTISRVAAIEKTRAAAELKTAMALSRAVQQISRVSKVIESLSKATTDGAQVVAAALTKIADSIVKKGA